MQLSSYRSLISILTLAILLAAPAPAHALRVHRGPTTRSHHKLKKSLVLAKKGIHGQRQIQSDRAVQIQTALIKAGYMTGTPTGQWDPQTTAALTRLQADNGWQTRITPDSRALIKLGLGPDSTTSVGSSAASLPVTKEVDSQTKVAQAN